VNWPSWNDAAVAAAVAVLLALVMRRARPNTWPGTVAAPAALEFALVASLYGVWRLARKLPLTHEEGAIDRAHQIVRLQADLHLPSELWLQQFVLAHDWLARLTNVYYATVHVPATIIFLIWLYSAHRDKYPTWRNALAILTGFCLFIRFVRVAPPRLMPGTEIIDLSTLYGLNIYGPVGSGVSDQFAAMPSIHVGWAAVVSVGVIVAGTSWMRWLVGLHVLVTMFVVSASGHHWWLDGIVSIGLLCLALVIDWSVRRLAARRRVGRIGTDLHGETGSPEEVAHPGFEIVPVTATVGAGASDR